MKGLVIYKGKYGATRQYAEWISESLGIPAMDGNNVHGKDLAAYNFVVLGSSIYFGKLLLGKWLKKNVSFLHNKKIFIFSVSGTPTDQIQVLQSCIESSVPAQIRGNMEVYFFPGRLNIKKLSLFHYAMLKVGAWLTKDPAVKKRMLTECDDLQQGHTRELERSVARFCKLPAGHLVT